MFTSRAEFRLTLRPDNADQRLTKKGFQSGCVSQERFEKTQLMQQNMLECIQLLKSITNSTHDWKRLFQIQRISALGSKNGFEVLGALHYEITFDKFLEAMPEIFGRFQGNSILAQRLKVIKCIIFKKFNLYIKIYI